MSEDTPVDVIKTETSEDIPKSPRIDVSVSAKESASNSKSHEIPPGYAVGGRPFENMVEWADKRIRGTRVDGVYVAHFSTNGKAYPNADDGYIDIAVGAREVSVTAHRKRDLAGAGNWADATVYFHLYKP